MLGKENTTMPKSKGFSAVVGKSRKKGKTGRHEHSVGYAVACLVVLVIIVVLVLWTLSPSWCCGTCPTSGQCTGVFDWTRGMGWAILIAIVLLVIFWFALY